MRLATCSSFCKLHKFARLTRRNYVENCCIQNKVTRAFSFFMGFGPRHIKTQKRLENFFLLQSLRVLCKNDRENTAHFLLLLDLHAIKRLVCFRAYILGQMGYFSQIQTPRITVFIPFAAALLQQPLSISGRSKNQLTNINDRPLIVAESNI